MKTLRNKNTLRELQPETLCALISIFVVELAEVSFVFAASMFVVFPKSTRFCKYTIVQKANSKVVQWKTHMKLHRRNDSACQNCCGLPNNGAERQREAGGKVREGTEKQTQ